MHSHQLKSKYNEFLVNQQPKQVEGSVDTFKLLQK